MESTWQDPGTGSDNSTWLPHRTPRCLYNWPGMNNLQKKHNFHHPFRSQFRSGLNYTLRDYLGRLRTVGGRGEHSGRACCRSGGWTKPSWSAGPVSDDILKVHGDLRFRVATRSASVPERAGCARRTVTSRQRRAGRLTGRARMVHWDGNARMCVGVETARRSHVAATPNGSE